MKRFLARLFLGFFIIALGLAFIQTPAYSQEPVARVSSFVGEVFVRSAVTPPPGEWRRLTAAPANLFNGDELRTQRGRAEVLYPNDDAVRILENSTARFSVSQEPRRRALFFRRLVNMRAVSTTAGRMWANVKVDRDNEMEFRSPAAVASVRGTILEWRYDPGAQVVFLGLAQGLAALTAQGVSVNVGANEAATVAAGQPPSAPFAYTPAPAPTISETAMAEALAAPPAALVAAPPVPVAPPPAAFVFAPPVTTTSFGSGGGGGTLAPPPVPSALICDDCFVQRDLGFTFPFYGQTYTSAFVSSNGYITFLESSNSGWSAYNTSVSNLFRGQASPAPRPTIATFHNDPDPSQGGTITLTQNSGSFVVTFTNVPDFFGSGISSFTTTLFSDGRIKMEYNNVTTLSGQGIPQIGISPGGLSALLNVVNFSSESGLNNYTGAIFQTFNNPAGASGTSSAISHADLRMGDLPTIRIVANFPGESSFTGTQYTGTPQYLGSTPPGGTWVAGRPFQLNINSGSFTLVYPTLGQSQSGSSAFTPITANTGTWSISSITSDTIPNGEFKFAAGMSFDVTIFDRPILNLVGSTLIFTPIPCEGPIGSCGYTVTDPPGAFLVAASPSS